MEPVWLEALFQCSQVQRKVRRDRSVDEVKSSTETLAMIGREFASTFPIPLQIELVSAEMADTSDGRVPMSDPLLPPLFWLGVRVSRH
ncbi:hypothetical protein Vadar_000698 [Vaccinium darrowii]|uniref:Uncharacterized protein n=1 Tax=Vaccinium darrowii TaxID=229202 RepID=A0ACB7Y4A3_9ERIC|nr:hypothetical protein Vadar_000698 [Vaccinium darrowii]